jgi:hypothetical protein
MAPPKKKTMSDELRFDVKKLQAMQVPLTVRAVALRGDTQMPLNIRHGSLSQNQAPGTGYTREEVMELESLLGKTHGGGHYEIGVVDANQSDMKWRFMLDPTFFPGPNKNAAPPQMPMGSGVHQPQPQQSAQGPLGYPQPGQPAQYPQYAPQQQQVGGAQVNPQQQNGGAQTATQNGSGAYVGQPNYAQPAWQVPSPGQSGGAYWPQGLPHSYPYPPGYFPYSGPPNSFPFNPYAYQQPQIQPQPAQPNNQAEIRMLQMEFQQSINNLTSSFKDEMRAFAEKAASSNQKADFSGLLDIVKLALPFAPQALSFFANKPKEDPAAVAMKEELRGLRETVQRQNEKREADLERQQMMAKVEQIQSATIKQLEDLKASVHDKASTQQVGVLDRVIDAFRGISADKPIPQGLQLADVVSLVTLMKDNGKGGDLRETIATFRELSETFGGGGEPSIWPKVLETLSGVTGQAIQAKAMQQRPQQVHYNPQTLPTPQQLPASTEGFNGAPQPAGSPLDALVRQQLTARVRELQAGAKQFNDTKGKAGLSPVEAAQHTKEAADKLISLNVQIELRKLFETARFGELARKLLDVPDADFHKWEEYLAEYVGTLEELTHMEAVDFWTEEEEEDEDAAEETPEQAAGKEIVVEATPQVPKKSKK